MKNSKVTPEKPRITMDLELNQEIAETMFFDPESSSDSKSTKSAGEDQILFFINMALSTTRVNISVPYPMVRSDGTSI